MTNKILIPCILLTFLIPNLVIASDRGHGKSKGAHVHGAMKIEMAVEGNNIELGIDAPAESFLGFEHAPKTAKEKKVFSDAEKLWTTELLTKLFMFDAKLTCTKAEASFKQDVDGAHSDIEAEAKIVCAQNLNGQTLSINLKKHFPHIKKIVVELIGVEAKTIVINNSTQTIKL